MAHEWLPEVLRRGRNTIRESERGGAREETRESGEARERNKGRGMPLDVFMSGS